MTPLYKPFRELLAILLQIPKLYLKKDHHVSVYTRISQFKVRKRLLSDVNLR